jgi:hypothetical protein
MKNEFLDGDTIFAIAVAAAIGLAAANLAIEVTNERAVLDASTVRDQNVSTKTDGSVRDALIPAG